MECGQHTTQSKQPASEKIPSTEHLYTTLLQDHIDHQCSTPPPGKGGIQWNWQHSVLKFQNTKNWEEAQLLAALPMHQIQPNGRIKDYLRYPDINKEHKLKTRKAKYPEGWSKKKHREKENCTTVKASHCTSYLWTLYLKFTNESQLSQNSKLRMHLKQELVLT